MILTSLVMSRTNRKSALNLLNITAYRLPHCDITSSINKKAQLSLTNPRDAKARQNCSNSTYL